MFAANSVQGSSSSHPVDLTNDASTLLSSPRSALPTHRVGSQVLNASSDRDVIGCQSLVIKPVKGYRRRSGEEVVSWKGSQIARTHALHLNIHPSNTAASESE